MREFVYRASAYLIVAALFCGCSDSHSDPLLVDGGEQTAFPPGNGTGLKGDYYDSIDFSDHVLTRTDATIDFNWRNGSPAVGKPV